jgi:hypothetical protein
MSESGKNASGEEAFGSKRKEVPVEQSLAVSAEDVTSSVIGAGATAVSAVEKAGTGTIPPTGWEQDDLCMADPQLTSNPRTAEAGGAHTEDDAYRCI